MESEKLDYGNDKIPIKPHKSDRESHRQSDRKYDRDRHVGRDYRQRERDWDRDRDRDRGRDYRRDRRDYRGDSRDRWDRDRRDYRDRSRHRSPPRERYDSFGRLIVNRKRSESPEPTRSRQESENVESKPDEEVKQSIPDLKPESQEVLTADNGEAGDNAEDQVDAEEEMIKLMGFGGFDSTKGKKVQVDVSAVDAPAKKRGYKQFMNRFRTDLPPSNKKRGQGD